MSKTILITGTSSGFGRDTAETLSKAGHKVFASMRDVNGRNKQNADALKAKGIEVVELDVTDEVSVERGVKEVLSKAGTIDVLVNNAGIAGLGLTESFTTSQAQAQFDVNVFGVLRTLRAVLPAFRKQGSGLIVNIGSVLGRVTLPFMGIYGATKFALDAITESYRYELSQLGIDITLIQPSEYPTNIFAVAQSPADAKRSEGYGDVAALPGQLAAGLTASFGTDKAQDPHDVAVAIAKLVEAGKGQRPARVVVGHTYGADAINEVTANVQTQLLAGIGLSQLGTTRN